MSVFLSSCSKDTAYVQIYKNNIPKEGISCLHLVVFPPNEMLENSLKELYSFDKSCGITLHVESKGGITCNATTNLQKKAMGSFPSSYINLQVSQDSKKIYSYYKDLENDVEADDIENAFLRIQKELNL